MNIVSEENLSEASVKGEINGSTWSEMNGGGKLEAPKLRSGWRGKLAQESDAPTVRNETLENTFSSLSVY